MADSQRPQIAKDAETQEMIRKAEEHFPNIDKNEAIQKEANMGPGREAKPGEGGGNSSGNVGGSGGVMQRVKNAVDTLKQANPATRDMKEKHC